MGWRYESGGENWVSEGKLNEWWEELGQSETK